jgi:hypothetical protein
VGLLRLAVPAVVVAFFLAGAQSSLGDRREQACDWGASSIAGTLVDGEFVVTAGPTTTGCVPR